MRKTYCIITALVVFILQSVVLPRVFNGIVQPNLILLFVIIVSLRFGLFWAAFYKMLLSVTFSVSIFYRIYWLPHLAVTWVGPWKKISIFYLYCWYWLLRKPTWCLRTSFCLCRDNSFLSFPTWHNIVFLCLYRTGF